MTKSKIAFNKDLRVLKTILSAMNQSEWTQKPETVDGVLNKILANNSDTQALEATTV